MTRQVLWLAAGLALGLPATGRAAPPSPDAAALAARIDGHLEAAWSAKGISPAPLSSDDEFVRRVYLDLAGRIPSVSEARAFLADDRPDWRRRLIADLLTRPTYGRRQTDVWRGLLLPEANASIQGRFLVPSFEAWLRVQFAENVGYDRFVRELLTARIDPNTSPFVVRSGPAGPPTPAAFYTAKEGKPENLTAATARLFLGIRLECAQCHDHPFAEWKRDQFWGLAAFYAGIRGRDPGNGFAMLEAEATDRREITVPGTSRVVKAVFPDGAAPDWKRASGRETLADWVTGPGNPYFARAAVNRVWASLFGTGLVDPVDEMVGGQDTVVHHEALLDELARSFIAQKYDLKFLYEAICSSRVYQLSSGGGSAAEATLFSRHPVRGLSAEQLFDSLAVATGTTDGRSDDRQGLLNPNSPRSEFVAKFAQGPGKVTEQETSIVQALTLMNGRTAALATDPDRSQLLGAVLDAPFLDTAGQIEALYLAALSRPPKAKELDRALAFVEKAADGAGSEKERAVRRRQAVADVFWALLNGGEFLLNH